MGGIIGAISNPIINTLLPLAIGGPLLNKNKQAIPDPKDYDPNDAAPRGGGGQIATGKFGQRYSPFQVNKQTASTLQMPSTAFPGRPGVQQVAAQRLQDQARALEARDTAMGTFRQFQEDNRALAQGVQARGDQEAARTNKLGANNFQGLLSAIGGLRGDADVALKGTLEQAQAGIDEIKAMFMGSLAQFKTDFGALKDSVKLDVSQRMSDHASAVNHKAQQEKEDAMANIMAGPGDATYKSNMVTRSQERIGMAAAESLYDTLAQFNQSQVEYMGDLGAKQLEEEASMYRTFQDTFTSAWNSARSTGKAAWETWGGMKKQAAALQESATANYNNFLQSGRVASNWINNVASQLFQQGDIIAAQGMSNLQLLAPELGPILEYELAYNLGEQTLRYDRDQAQWAQRTGIDAAFLNLFQTQSNLMAQYGAQQRQFDEQMAQSQRQNEWNAGIGVGGVATSFGGFSQAATQIPTGQPSAPVGRYLGPGETVFGG